MLMNVILLVLLKNIVILNLLKPVLLSQIYLHGGEGSSRCCQYNPLLISPV